MADDPRAPQDQERSRIRPRQDEDVRDWSQRLGVSPEKLKKVVKKVGTDARAVRAHLKGISKPR